MLYWIKGNGIENIFSLNDFNIYGSTINSINSESDNVQYLPNSMMFIEQPTTYYINITSQLTQQENFLKIGDVGSLKPSESVQFSIYIDSSTREYHIDLDNGIYDFELFWGEAGATSKNESKILSELTSGLVMVMQEDLEGKYYNNSENGITELTIPTTISYNG